VPSDDPIQRFQDILDNIACIEEFTAGMDLDAFSRNNQALYAVKHAMLIISEAAKKLGGIAEDLCPHIPWPQVRAIGNHLRHGYDRVDVIRIWLVTQNEILPLKAAVDGALKRLWELEDGHLT